MGIIEKSDRLKSLPPYLFKEIDRKKEEVRASGVDIIDLGIGDPDLPTPDHIITELREVASDPANHQYPSYSGMMDFRIAVAEWYKKRFDVELEPATETLTLVGSKEGIAHLPLAFINPGDVALIPSPGYPVYSVATNFAGGECHIMPLVRENDFLPDLEAIPSVILGRAKVMFINYPNNPTAATADVAFFNRVVDFAKEHNILVCHDAAYTEMSYDGYSAPSFMESDGAKDVGIEFHSLSKTYNMTGWRIGFAVGNKDAIEGLGSIKSNVDSGVFQAVQIAGIKALRYDQTCVEDMREIYARRRDMMAAGLKDAGFELEAPKATFYMWVKVPEGYSSTQLATRLLEKGVVVTPGNGFGEPGEGYFRIALTQRRDRLAEAIERIKSVSF